SSSEWYLVAAPRLPANYQKVRPVQLMGTLNWYERYRAFDGATLVVVPSRCEPYGMVIAEAIACGVPVLYSRSAGVADRIGHDGSIDPSDIKGTCERVIKLVRDFNAWEELLELQQ